MCLVVKDTKYKIADKDIICYKVLIHNMKWMTPFNHTVIKIEIIEGKDILVDDKDFNDSFIEEFKQVHEGGFHCYANKEDAIIDKQTCYNEYVFECIIPKGSIYYDGDFFGWHSYVAKHLKFIKQI